MLAIIFTKMFFWPKKKMTWQNLKIVNSGKCLLQVSRKKTNTGIGNFCAVLAPKKLWQAFAFLTYLRAAHQINKKKKKSIKT